MEMDKSNIKKTLFGNYRAEDVDKLLSEARTALEQRQAERAREAEEQRSLRAELDQTAQALREQQRAAAQLQGEVERLRELNSKFSDTCHEQSEEALRLRGELEDLRRQLEKSRTELEMANSQAAILGDRVARQRRELEEKDRLLLEDPVGEANKRAGQIIQNAKDLSRQMMEDAENMRSRALASVRAAYFNTVDFRENLMERFISLQNDMDQSIRTLRAIEREDEESIPVYPLEK